MVVCGLSLCLEKVRERSISTYILSMYLDIKTTKQMTRGLLQSFGRRRNKIATFAVMYHVHVNSFPVWSYAAVAIEAAMHSGQNLP